MIEGGSCSHLRSFPNPALLAGPLREGHSLEPFLAALSALGNHSIG
jgi:hypothetical protein